MANENTKVQIPVAEPSTLVEETLQIEELEPRVAPMDSTVWGS